MCLTAPQFWYRPRGLTALALSPLSWGYNAGHIAHQMIHRPYRAQIPVICVGNLVVGGSGKTPTAIAIHKLVKDNLLAKAPCFLSRGYGSGAKGHFLVNDESHEATDVGDEPLLLSELAPTIIAPHRGEGARYAESHHYDLIIMDDGLQNPTIEKDLKIVVIDGVTGFGNRMMLPAGPLREPLATGLEKADAIIMIGNDETGAAALLPEGKPAFHATIEVPDSWIANRDTSYVAFSGIAHPSKFKTSLEKMDLNIALWHPFPDHYQFTPHDLRELADEAGKLDARLITTAKDAVRIPREFSRELPLDILPVELRWKDPQAVAAFLKNRIEAA